MAHQINIHDDGTVSIETEVQTGYSVLRLAPPSRRAKLVVALVEEFLGDTTGGESYAVADADGDLWAYRPDKDWWEPVVINTVHCPFRDEDGFYFSHLQGLEAWRKIINQEAS